MGPQAPSRRLRARREQRARLRERARAARSRACDRYVQLVRPAIRAETWTGVLLLETVSLVPSPCRRQRIALFAIRGGEPRRVRRSARVTARDRCLTDRQTLHFCSPSFSVPPGLQVERNATCTKKLQKNEHQLNSKADGPLNSAPA